MKLSEKLKYILRHLFVLFSLFTISAITGYIIEPQPSIIGSPAWDDGYTWETIGIFNQFLLYIIIGVGYIFYAITTITMVILTIFFWRTIYLLKINRKIFIRI